MFKHIIIFIILFILEIIYIRIARNKGIKDIPNHRSSHEMPTIRGGGIVIFLSIILYTIFYPITITEVLFLIALSCVSTISFLDDLVSLSTKTRFLFQIIAFILISYLLGFLEFEVNFNILKLFIFLFFSLGFLNIYNFMDGINGITFLNALITFLSLLYINQYYMNFIDNNLLITIILSVIVFGFFNFRKKALCFAGDIGSITIGFTIIYLIVKAYIVTNNFLIFGLVFVYLLDGGWTIVRRLFEGENIFKPHRSHLYQKLTNELKIGHLKVAVGYFIFQTLINCIVIYFMYMNKMESLILFVIAFMGSIFYYMIFSYTKKLYH